MVLGKFSSAGASYNRSSGSGFGPRSRRNLLNRKRGSIAHSFSLSSAHRPDMPEIVLKRT